MQPIMRLSITQALHAEITAHLERTYPNEGGGFLIGKINADTQTVTQVRTVENVFESEEQYHRYLMEDGAFQDAEDAADEKGLTLLGYFHSHPDSPAIPSEFDRVHALPNFLYLITSIRGGSAAETRLWQLDADRSKFNEMTLEVS
jgi:proteasome lid subunit RPN8/RPN11